MGNYESDPELYRKDGKPRLVIQCYRCQKKTMRVTDVNRAFISGDGYYYECSSKDCGAADKHIL